MSNHNFSFPQSDFLGKHDNHDNHDNHEQCSLSNHGRSTEQQQRAPTQTDGTMCDAATCISQHPVIPALRHPPVAGTGHHSCYATLFTQLKAIIDKICGALCPEFNKNFFFY